MGVFLIRDEKWRYLQRKSIRQNWGEKVRRLSDGRVLYLEIGLKGQKLWRFRYRKPDTAKDTSSPWENTRA